MTLAIGVTGPRHIHTLRPPPYVFDGVYDHGDYHVYAYIQNGDTFTPATITSVSWSFKYGASTRLYMSLDANDQTHMTLFSDTPIANLADLTEDKIVVKVGVSEPSKMTQTMSFFVQTSARWYLKVMLRWPQNGVNGTGGLGQTQRPWGSPIVPGTVNNFFYTVNDPQQTRLNDRNNFSGDLCGKTSAVLAQAGIKLYDTPDGNFLPFPGGIFNALGQIPISLPNGQKSPQVRFLYSTNLPGVGNHSVVNVYMVHGVWDGYLKADPNGVSFRLDAGGTSTTILLSDDASFGGYNGVPFVEGIFPEYDLAHEFGHSMTLLDVKLWTDLTGDLNNLKNVTADSALEVNGGDRDPRNPLNWNLMRYFSSRHDKNSTWLTDDQVNIIRATIANHPALGSDHGPED